MVVIVKDPLDKGLGRGASPARSGAPTTSASTGAVGAAPGSRITKPSGTADMGGEEGGGAPSRPDAGGPVLSVATNESVCSAGGSTTGRAVGAKPSSSSDAA